MEPNATNRQISVVGQKRQVPTQSTSVHSRWTRGTSASPLRKTWRLVSTWTPSFNRWFSNISYIFCCFCSGAEEMERRKPEEPWSRLGTRPTVQGATETFWIIMFCVVTVCILWLTSFNSKLKKHPPGDCSVRLLLCSKSHLKVVDLLLMRNVLPSFFLSKIVWS